MSSSNLIASALLGSWGNPSIVPRAFTCLPMCEAQTSGLATAITLPWSLMKTGSPLRSVQFASQVLRPALCTTHFESQIQPLTVRPLSSAFSRIAEHRTAKHSHAIRFIVSPLIWDVYLYASFAPKLNAVKSINALSCAGVGSRLLEPRCQCFPNSK